MQYKNPEVRLLGSTGVDDMTVDHFLEALGAANFQSDAHDGEELIEIAGRLCYKSFEVGLNKNVTKVREGNKNYIANILKSRHGSVLEHASVTFGLLNVSRIFTHEIVRHRAGTAFSQESMRFVRVDEVSLYKPDAFEKHLAPVDAEIIMAALNALASSHEEQLKAIMNMVPWDKLDFHAKKVLTSALRRWGLAGQLTNIIVTANHREWRHICQMRISEGAEEEIVKIQTLIAEQLQEAFPNIYQDMTFDENGFVHFEHEKV